MRLYHVSPAKNYEYIFWGGLQPSFALGARKVVWLVTRDKVVWALAHVSARHSVSVDELGVFVVDASLADIRRTRWAHVFTCERRIEVARMDEVGEYLDERGEDVSPE